MKGYEFLEHTADVKFKAIGKDLEEAFKNSALALKETMTEGEKILNKQEKLIEAEGIDNVSLLYNFLEEFLFLFDSEGFVLSSIDKITIKNNKISAKVFGDNSENYKFSNSVKAITYHDMKVIEKGDSFEIIGIFDV
jgi:SHS2 domain-containing protein